MIKYSVNGYGGTHENLETLFNSRREAHQAWKAAGCPTQKGSDVWISDYNTDTFETTTTTTIYRG